MELCLVRHAIAVDRGLPGMADAARPLTDKGRARMEMAAVGLVRLFEAEVVLTSPLRRAVETAEILLDAYGLRELHKSDALATGDDDHLFTEMAATGKARVIVVGHEPHMSRTLSYVLTGDHGLVSSVFKKGGAVLVSFEDGPVAGGGWIEWMMQPAALRASARS